MKTEIFTYAIRKRIKIRFIYNLQEIIIEPYFLSTNKLKNKILFGRIEGSSEIKQFEYLKIFNIRLLYAKKFSPIIPILKTA